MGGLRIAENSTAVLINPERAKLIKEEQRVAPEPPSPPEPDLKPIEDEKGVL